MRATEVKNLTMDYRGNIVLDRFNLTLDEGRIVGLLGPNGAGKTTLLKILAGLEMNYKGDVAVFGNRPGPLTKSYVSYQPDHLPLPKDLTAEDTIGLYDHFYNDFDGGKAREMLERFKLEGDRRIREMSKGMRDKLQITLTLSRKAKLYLLDEPIGGVDPAARDYILQTVIRAYRPQSSIILSTHLVRDVEAFLDDFILLRYGQMLLHAPVAYVTQEKGTTLDAFFREEFRC